MSLATGKVRNVRTKKCRIERDHPGHKAQLQKDSWPWKTYLFLLSASSALSNKSFHITCKQTGTDIFSLVNARLLFYFGLVFSQKKNHTNETKIKLETICYAHKSSTDFPGLAQPPTPAYQPHTGHKWREDTWLSCAHLLIKAANNGNVTEIMLTLSV